MEIPDPPEPDLVARLDDLVLRAAQGVECVNVNAVQGLEFATVMRHKIWIVFMVMQRKMMWGMRVTIQC